jgi:hypothetical protein
MRLHPDPGDGLNEEENVARSRREFFRTVGAGAAGLAIGMPAAEAAAARASEGPVLQTGDDIAVVSTTDGKVRGYVLRGSRRCSTAVCARSTARTSASGSTTPARKALPSL